MIVDHSSDVRRDLNLAIEQTLDEIGEFCEGEAVNNLYKQHAVNTGRLADSIDHKVDGKTLYIGTNVEYAVYIECGTGAVNFQAERQSLPGCIVTRSGTIIAHIRRRRVLT